MKAEFYICMTSGVEGPKSLLSDEVSQQISNLAAQLTEPWDGSKFAGHGLSHSNYLVLWNDESPIVAIRTEPSGFVSMWKRGDTEWCAYKDTVGLWAALAPSGSAALQKWLADAQKAMEGAAPRNFPSIFKNGGS